MKQTQISIKVSFLSLFLLLSLLLYYLIMTVSLPLLFPTVPLSPHTTATVPQPSPNSYLPASYP